MVDYVDNNKFKALASILEDYTEWFAQLSLYVSYPDEERPSKDFAVPSSFEKWLRDSDAQSEISNSIMKSIVDIYHAMRSVGLEVIEILKASQKPPYQDFFELKNLYSSFLASIRRLEKDSAMRTDGTDDLTGLRPANAVEHDLKREMERLVRNGNPFSLVMIRIDGFDSLDNRQSVISLVTQNIKKSLRPFDDAYYLGSARYLLSLKHADLVGAEAAVMRIQQSLTTDIANDKNITISCCMSEPVDGDKMSDLLKNMKNDLKEHEENFEAVLKFLDISPLERYITSKN